MSLRSFLKLAGRSLQLSSTERSMAKSRSYIGTEHVQTMKGDHDEIECGIALDEKTIIFGTNKYGAL
jgi:hypothetical protein